MMCRHRYCHWCGRAGHIALACTAVSGAAGVLPGAFGAESSVVVHGTGAPATPGTAACGAPPQRLTVAAPFLYVLGGRLRGRTLVSAERINLLLAKEQPCAPPPLPRASPPPGGSPRAEGPAAAVSHFCASIGSPCLRQCVHGASIG
jgi:hypothetical protein